MSQQERGSKKVPVQKSKMPIGHSKDVEFSEDMADQEDWEALERSERADARQQGQFKL
ncbi:YfhD family protein [Paenibacillus puldeungensis]|uniref:YfhD family protein n=1 Tax=Paenibacillus puldeungensis TaxID=696536 RepID=A0ABW3S0U0_9BACL